MRQTLDDLHGDVLVASVTVQLTRNGNMALSGTITDEDYILGMLETAADYLRGQKAKRDIANGGTLVVPSYDTALHRTPLEQKLERARHEIADTM
jgi:hypothetical protein